MALLLPDGGGVRSGNRQHHRRRQPAQSPAGLQEGSRLQRLPGEPLETISTGAATPVLIVRVFPASSVVLRRGGRKPFWKARSSPRRRQPLIRGRRPAAILAGCG